MKMLNRVPEVQNLSTIVSDRDETLLLTKLDMLDSKTDTLTSLRYARYYDKVRQGCATMIATNGACSTLP